MVPTLQSSWWDNTNSLIQKNPAYDRVFCYQTIEDSIDYSIVYSIDNSIVYSIDNSIVYSIDNSIVYSIDNSVVIR